MTVAVLTLTVAVLGLLVDRQLTARGWERERAGLVRAVVARHAAELAGLEQAAVQPPVKVRERKATDDRLGVNLDGQLVDKQGVVVDESALIGLPGN